MLKKLWAEGLSASQIAGKMGGVTRNAVIGKVHRLGLSGRATPAKPSTGRASAPRRVETASPTVEKPQVYRAEPEAKPIISAPEVSQPLVLDTGDKTTVATLNRNMCKWPIGDPAKDDFPFLRPTLAKRETILRLSRPYCIPAGPAPCGSTSRTTTPWRAGCCTPGRVRLCSR